MRLYDPGLGSPPLPDFAVQLSSNITMHSLHLGNLLLLFRDLPSRRVNDLATVFIGWGVGYRLSGAPTIDWPLCCRSA